MLTQRNFLVIKLTLIINIFLVCSLVNAQTIQDFYNLLPAYKKASEKLTIARLSQIPSEIAYWEEQYKFYKKRVENIIDKYEQAAMSNPQAYCLTALELYDKYFQVDQAYVEDELPDDYIFRSGNLSTYCARFDIYYKRPEPRM